MARNNYHGTEFVTALDPETGKTALVTRKAFDSVYKEKGFELVDRENVDEATPAARRGRKPGESKRTDADTNIGGGAADIAKAIGVDDSGKSDDEGKANTKNQVSDERGSNKRDRGGR